MNYGQPRRGYGGGRGNTGLMEPEDDYYGGQGSYDGYGGSRSKRRGGTRADPYGEQLLDDDYYGNDPMQQGGGLAPYGGRSSGRVRQQGGYGRQSNMDYGDGSSVDSYGNPIGPSGRDSQYGYGSDDVSQAPSNAMSGSTAFNRRRDGRVAGRNMAKAGNVLGAGANLGGLLSLLRGGGKYDAASSKSFWASLIGNLIHGAGIYRNKRYHNSGGRGRPAGVGRSRARGHGPSRPMY